MSTSSLPDAHPISGATRVLGLIADPATQARAPGMANALLAARGRSSRHVLVPLQVPADGLAATIAALRSWRNLDGAIVSMPHKIAVCSLLDELTPQARQVGAVNVIRREEDVRGDAQGRVRLIGTVMDGEGFVGGLARAGHEVKGRHCLLAGAGGAASAIAFSLAAHGCASLTLINRTRNKAQALAERLAAAYPGLPVGAPDLDAAGAALAGERYGLAVNATSLGMRTGDALPLSEALIDASDLVAECVISPEITPLLAAARARGKLIHTGPPMLAAQMEMMLEFMGAAE